ncbi:MAG: class I SAM-dependent methyltransferase [Propionibacteriaceae bacterium]
MSEETTNESRQKPPEHTMQGHWLLAQLGKRVLRPGGVELTRKLLAAAKPAANDSIIEFGPGVGKTAAELLAAKPERYIGVDPNPQGTPALKAVIAPYGQAELVVSGADDVPLPDAQATLVVGEAMLTMQSQSEKEQIVAEAYRLLKPGGRYAIHELERTNEVDLDCVGSPADAVSKDVSRSIKVGARPLTCQGWQDLLTAQGFEIIWSDHAPMRLLEPSRIFADEGFFGGMRFFFNVARNPAARARVKTMRATFREHADQLGAIAIVACKKAE